MCHCFGVLGEAVPYGELTAITDSTLRPVVIEFVLAAALGTLPMQQ
jgi:hypothetical protein